jgi:hypothetical protein
MSGRYPVLLGSQKYAALRGQNVLGNQLHDATVSVNASDQNTRVNIGQLTGGMHYTPLDQMGVPVGAQLTHGNRHAISSEQYALEHMPRQSRHPMYNAGQLASAMWGTNVATFVFSDAAVRVWDKLVTSGKIGIDSLLESMTWGLTGLTGYDDASLYRTTFYGWNGITDSTPTPKSGQIAAMQRKMQARFGKYGQSGKMKVALKKTHTWTPAQQQLWNEWGAALSSLSGAIVNYQTPTSHPAVLQKPEPAPTPKQLTHAPAVTGQQQQHTSTLPTPPPLPRSAPVLPPTIPPPKGAQEATKPAPTLRPNNKDPKTGKDKTPFPILPVVGGVGVGLAALFLIA